MAKLSSVFNDTQFDSSGNLLSGGLIYTYAAGSVTPQTTYTSSSGLTAQSNPIVLNARAEVASPIWLTEGLSYKLRLFDSNNNFIREFDNITGIGDNTVSLDQWVSSGVTPTYINATSFTVPGDQTSSFTVGRRVKATVTAGTVYGTITSSAFTALTTVTLSMDGASILDAGLSSVQLGLITPDNTSAPILPDNVFRVSGNADKTKKVALEVDGLTTATTRTLTVQDKDGTIALTSDITALGITNTPQIRQSVLFGPVDASGFSSFGGATGTTTVTATGTLTATAANGTLNRTGSITNPAWTGLSTNGTMYLYLDIDSAGVCTTGSTTLAPNYRWGGADVTTNNQFTFNIQEMTGKVGNGATSTQTYRVFVGEVTVAGAVVTAITWYALMGRFDSGYINTWPASGVLTSFNHNIGYTPDIRSIYARCITADLNYVPGDVINPSPAATGVTVSNFNLVSTYKTIGFSNITAANPLAFLNKTSGVTANPTLASWAYRVTASRGW